MKTILLFFALLCLSFKGSLTYDHLKNDIKTTSKWIAWEKNQDFHMTRTKDKSTEKLTYPSNFILKTFQFDSKNSSYLFSLNNNILKCIGQKNNKNHAKTHNLQKEIWVQDFNFGFLPFLKSKDEKFLFVTLNPYDFTLNKMIATKTKKEAILINDKEYDAQKINITLRGFKSHFWKAEVWYNVKNNTLLKYKANEGPRTPVEIITLKE